MTFSGDDHRRRYSVTPYSVIAEFKTQHLVADISCCTVHAVPARPGRAREELIRDRRERPRSMGWRPRTCSEGRFFQASASAGVWPNSSTAAGVRSEKCSISRRGGPPRYRRARGRLPRAESIGYFQRIHRSFTSCRAQEAARYAAIDSTTTDRMLLVVPVGGRRRQGSWHRDFWRTTRTRRWPMRIPRHADGA